MIKKCNFFTFVLKHDKQIISDIMLTQNNVAIIIVYIVFNNIFICFRKIKEYEKYSSELLESYITLPFLMLLKEDGLVTSKEYEEISKYKISKTKAVASKVMEIVSRKGPQGVLMLVQTLQKYMDLNNLKKPLETKDGYHSLNSFETPPLRDVAKELVNLNAVVESNTTKDRYHSLDSFESLPLGDVLVAEEWVNVDAEVERYITKNGYYFLVSFQTPPLSDVAKEWVDLNNVNKRYTTCEHYSCNCDFI